MKIRCMRIACWIPKNTNTHSEYVILLFDYMVWSCRENEPKTFTKNYDSLGTWRKEKTRLSLKNLERGDIHSHEWKRPKNGRMEQQKAMEYGSRKASSDVVNPRNIIYIYIHILFDYKIGWTSVPHCSITRTLPVLFSDVLKSGHSSLCSKWQCL
jgi:hypothetical protein